MKKVLSVFLAVAMLLGTVVIGVSAASDTCIKLTDTSGSSSYSAAKDAVNTWVKENDGATLIFDVKLLSTSTPASGQSSRLIAFSGDGIYNYAGFDFTNGKFVAGQGTAWPTETTNTNYTALSSRSYTWKNGTWYEIAYQFDGREVTVYLDGMPMVSAEVDKGFETKYLLLYPQYCSVLIDNLRICGKDYNVRDRYGDVYATTDFSGISSVSAAAYWDFAGDGYSVSSEGRPMPELGDMLPARTVTPSIDGAYMKYTEGKGNGSGSSAINLGNYNGFTYVEDVRVDRKSALASMGVRFGGDYIAGYDWDSGCFRIANKSGFGFSNSEAYIYASTSYALSLKTTYELAVRRNGNVVSVYLNGVLMAQAKNDAFANSTANIEVSHYRMGASIDNAVLAYPDYNVKEATGSSVAKFTFDESVSYIDGIIDFSLDNGVSGYTITKDNATAATVTVANVEAVDNKANVGITLANCTDFTSFKLDISYDNKLSVAQVAPQSILNGTYVISPTTNNPLTVAYVSPANGYVPDGKIINLVLNTPSAEGNYSVTVTVTPYIEDVPGASFSGTGTVSVPEPEMLTGLPSGLSYDGEYFTWDHYDLAAGYEIYMLYEGDDYETYVDFTDEDMYYFPYEDYISDAGMYTFRVYMYDENAEIASVSEDLDVIVEEDGNIICGGLTVYAGILYQRLADYVAENEYSAANQTEVDAYLEDAYYYLYEAVNYSDMYEIYVGYDELIRDIPVKKDVTIGLPAGVSYDGSAVKWNAVSGASKYDVYVKAEGDTVETLIGTVKTTSLAYAADNFTDADLYTFKVYVYDSTSEIIGESNPYSVIIADGTAYSTFAAYAAVKAEELAASVADNDYTDENAALIEEYVADAESAMANAVTFAELVEAYNDYKNAIDKVPVKKIIAEGVPAGLAYDGETITWDAADNAATYGVFILFEGESEEQELGYSDSNYFEYPANENITENGVYTFRVYVYDSDSDVVGISDDLTLIVETDGSVFADFAEYAEELADRLAASVADNDYTDENAALVESAIAEAKIVMAAAETFADVVKAYDDCVAALAEIPTGSTSVLAGDVNGDGSIDNTDFSLLSRFLRGASVSVTGGADLNGDGSINNLDLSQLAKKLK